MTTDDQEGGLNRKALERFKGMDRDQPSAEELFQGIRNGDRTLLSRGITLIENRRTSTTEKARELVEKCLPFSGDSIRIGITGVPGVGKSTFLEALGKHLTSQGKKVAVLAIDPSSTSSGGSILGDKTRMETLASDRSAFIRPSPSAGSLGGVARKTREAIILCEAAGFDHVFVETVGVGQSETTVHSLVDFFLLLMLPGAGDELQGIKRGIMEMADAIVINKADGKDLSKAKQAKKEYNNALHLMPPSSNGWQPRVETCSSTTGEGIRAVWEIVETFFSDQKANGFLLRNRKEQAKYWMHRTIEEELKDRFYRAPGIKERIKEVEEKVMEGSLSSYAGARELMEQFQKY